MKFIVVVPVFNCASSIASTIRSVQCQSFTRWRCVVMDDMSTDGTADVAEEMARDDDRIVVIRNREKKYALRNMAEAIDLAEPGDEDVVVCLDGDDRLAGPVVFERLVAAYQRDNAWMTYGSYIGSDSGSLGQDCFAYRPLVHMLRSYRRSAWRASHLKTFKVWLWRKIDHDDLGITEQQMKAFCRHMLMTGRVISWWKLRNVPLSHVVECSGRYFRRCVDKAIMYPMLEMASDRAVHIPDVLYVYR